jgi:hypothetical protein
MQLLPIAPCRVSTICLVGLLDRLSILFVVWSDSEAVSSNFEFRPSHDPSVISREIQ